MDGALQTLELQERCEAPFHAAHGYANAELEPRVGRRESPVRSGVGGVFSCIVADPPWDIDMEGGSHESRKAGNWDKEKVRALPYPTMSVQEIAALKVPAAKDAHWPGQTARDAERRERAYRPLQRLAERER